MCTYAHAFTPVPARSGCSSLLSLSPLLPAHTRTRRAEGGARQMWPTRAGAVARVQQLLNDIVEEPKGKVGRA